MLFIAAVAIAASMPQGAPRQSVGAVVQATATVRVISGVQIRLDGQSNAHAPPAREGVVHTAGAPQTAKLIEFE